MRIALLAHWFAEYTRALAEGLVDAGHEVLFVVERGAFEGELGEVPRPGPRLQVEIVEHRAHPVAALRTSRQMLRSIQRFHPDVVHAQEAVRDSQMAVLPLLRRQYPLVVTVHDPVPHMGQDTARQKMSRDGAYLWATRRLADAAIVHGHSLKDELERVVPRLSGRTWVVPHGVLGASVEDPPVADAEPGRSLFFGRIEEYKNLPAFVLAIEHLSAEGVSVHGRVAGRGSALTNDLRRRIERCDALSLHEGYLTRTELLREVDRASIVVQPYLEATQSGVSLLALGRGRPVLATDVGEVPMVVRDGVNGLVVPPNDQEALEDALGRVVRDGDLWRGLQQGAVESSCGDLSWPAIARTTVGVYEATVGRRASA